MDLVLSLPLQLFDSVTFVIRHGCSDFQMREGRRRQDEELVRIS